MKKQVVLLSVGVDAGCGGIQGPLFEDGTFQLSSGAAERQKSFDEIRIESRHVNEAAGKVAYLKSGVGNHEYSMPDLMDTATAGLHVAAGAVESFRLLVEQHFVEAFAAEGIIYKEA